MTVYIFTKEQLEEFISKMVSQSTVDYRLLPEPVTVPTWDACLSRRNEVENWPADAAFQDGIDCICEALKIKSPC